MSSTSLADGSTSCEARQSQAIAGVAASTQAECTCTHSGAGARHDDQELGLPQVCMLVRKEAVRQILAKEHDVGLHESIARVTSVHLQQLRSVTDMSVKQR
jgi:hypothetical protein